MSDPRGAGLQEIELGGLHGLHRAAGEESGAAVILLHGYGGDERAMWVFGQGIPRRHPVYSFRGLFAAEEGGYRWHVGRRWPPPPAEVLDPAVEALRLASEEIDSPEGVIWIGFSQGAALAFHGAASGPPALAVACLAGYLPDSTATFPGRVPVFWAHGTQDERVPIEIARKGVDQLRAAGARVEFCEADVGHKLSAGCLRALRAWIERQSSPP